jgi:hypothetical protein
MTPRSAHPLWLVLTSLAACTDQPYEVAADPCAVAADILARCGHAVEQSPFGTCRAEQRVQAEHLIALYEADGCALTSVKADSATCTLLPFLCVHHTVDELAPFVTDGCSMFPDGTLSDATRWQHCCIEHDFAYYAGGPEDARQAADGQLQACVQDASSRGLADLMYYGVRVGGTPALPTPWRWGYGWTYDPLDGYRTLPPDQAAAAAESVAAYLADPVAPAAIEQRLRALADVIASVPGLQDAIDRVDAVVRHLE